MASWIITKDHTYDPRYKVIMPDAKGTYKGDKNQCCHEFKMYDDDGVLYYNGLSSDKDSEGAFSPLDDFGTPNAGCTEIRYKEGDEFIAI